MELVKKNWRDWSAVVRAWRLARWANHAWGNLPDGALPEVWNLCPSLAGFAQLLPGYAVAKNWTVEGPVGWGILAPEYCHDEQAGQWLRVWVGSHSQLRVDCYPERTEVLYSHPPRWAEAVCDADGVVVGVEGFKAAPRDWARIARVLAVAYDLREQSAEGILESLRMMAGANVEEFDRFIKIEGPDIFAGAEVPATVE